MGQRVSGLVDHLNPFSTNNPAPEVSDDFRRRRASREDPSSDHFFFGSHFLMGGKRFEVAKPEAFLFGQNSDLDLFGSPVKFPYGGVSETVGALNALVNIRKDSIKIVRNEREGLYNLEFIFDTDVNCYIQVHYCARELIENNLFKFDVRLPDMKPSEKFYFSIGANQVFNRLTLEECQFDPQKINYNGGFWYPVVIEIRTADEECGFKEQVQITMCIFEKSSNAGCPYALKPLKQKLITDGVIFVMQEVFGIENRETDRDRAFECVVCRDNPSDTLLLPCRHLCICNQCDSDFLSNVKECPICRTPVKALLTLNAVKSIEIGTKGHNSAIESVHLTEALNGPFMLSRAGSRRSVISRRSSQTSSLRSKRNATLDSRGSSGQLQVFPPSIHENPASECIELEDIVSVT
ncbi:unnamed protein product [Bursaphelenchus xylophilus]|uniref:RING-type E3 ubiquitin transferase n=1 Tax=Bursaphelenchus xylophilus TaxID=6326 RepID=A0A1I7SSD5_BURXY|nr:unnamed protein product [Bursaphelenchus xylophilus]CAG9097691.1 unnamed protein product [Bursaphelenchus xylophilus]